MANKHNTQNPRLCALRVANPILFVHEVTTAIKRHDGEIGDTADFLHVSRRTLANWVNEFKLWKLLSTGDTYQQNPSRTPAARKRKGGPGRKSHPGRI